LIRFNQNEITHQLFIPPADPLVTMWSVAPLTLEQAKEQLQSDDISHTTGFEKALQGMGETVIHTLPLTMEYPPLTAVKATETRYLLDALHVARLIKDDAEIDLIREANRISSGAHEVLMRELGRYAKGRQETKGGRVRTRDGSVPVSQWEVESEMDAEALFVATCKRAG
jgi:Xaa-Pro dipeptidase